MGGEVSNTVKCREAHGGKFTRPKRLWKGHRRRGATRRVAGGNMTALINKMATARPVGGKTFGTLNFRRKAG